MADKKSACRLKGCWYLRMYSIKGPISIIDSAPQLCKPYLSLLFLVGMQRCGFNKAWEYIVIYVYDHWFLLKAWN